MLWGLLLFCVGCSRTDREATPVAQGQVHANPSALISAVSSGEISRFDTIRMVFSKPAPSAPIGGKPDAQFSEYLRFEPAIAGKATWRTQSVLEFQPDKPLPSGQIFNAFVTVAKLFPGEGTRTDGKPDFTFYTPRRALNIQVGTAESAKDIQQAVIRGSIETSDVEQNMAIEALLVATQNGQNLAIDWQHADKLHRFTILDVVRSDQASEVKVAWDGVLLDVPDFQGSETVAVPSRRDFRFVRALYEQSPDSQVVFTFSDPLKADQDLRGLITTDAFDMDFVISRNRVIASPRGSQAGDVVFKIHSGIRNFAGVALSADVNYTVLMENQKPQLRIVSGKHIISEQNQFLVPFEAINLKSVDVQVTKIFGNNLKQYFQNHSYGDIHGLKMVGKPVLTKKVALDPYQKLNLRAWNRHVLNLSELVESDPTAIYSIQIGFRKSYIDYPCGDVAADSEPQNPYALEPDLWEYYDNPPGGYSWRHREDPCHDAYYQRYNGNNLVNTSVFASNIGLLAKYAEEKQDLLVAVNNIQSAEPIAGAKVTIYDFVHQELAVGTTDVHGMVFFEGLADEPALIHTTHQQDQGYLPIKKGQALSMSRFDVGGLSSVEGINGFLYGERGVWRPGDAIFLTFILEDQQARLPAGHPVVLEFRDPRGRLVTREVERQAVGNFYRFDLKTSDDAPTGPYTATVMVGGTKFEKMIRVETVRPNRLKLKLDLLNESLKSGQNQQAKLQVNWLHGAPLRNGKVDVKMSLRDMKTTFARFPDMIFDDPSRSSSSSESTLYEGTTNQAGLANVSFQMPNIYEAPGRLEARFALKAFEPGGAYSIDFETKTVDPYEVYVGMRLPERDPDWQVLYTDQTNQIEIATVNADGSVAAHQEVELTLYKLSWRWWWDSESGYYPLYQARNAASPVVRAQLVTDENGKAIYPLEVDDELWGRFLCRVSHEKGHATGETTFMYRHGWSMPPDADQAGATLLTIKKEKDQVQVGDVVRLTVPTSPMAKLLLSLEQGESVLSTRWIDASSVSTEVSFKVTPEMVPNVYAHITMLQPNQNPENDLPLRMYGVASISVEDSGTVLKPTLSMPDVLEPETQVTLQVAEATGKPMSYTIAMVDEGLLDLTRFATPNPRDRFFAKRALQLQTWDLYDSVQGAFSGQFQALLSVGGGAAGTREQDPKAKRFPPMVQFLGPFQLAAGQKAEHVIDMPRYIGSVRTMVVAGTQGAYGMADKTTPVRKPLMVLGALPRVLTPDEVLDMPITVFAMEPGVGEVQIAVKADGPIRVLQPSQTIRFDGVGEETLRFPINVASSVGHSRIMVTATSASHQATYEVNLEVRSPNPVTTDVADLVVSPGSQSSVAYEPLGLTGSHEGWLELSAIPPINLATRLDDLIHYPYGCLEQTTSAVFAQLRLTDLSKLEDSDARELANNITAGIRRIANFQLFNGGLSYWPGELEVSDWGSLYAGHFMIAARDAGYTLPPDFMQRWLNYQSLQANRWVEAQSPRYQSYRLYLLALAGKPEIGAMNRFREVGKLPNLEQWLLAAAYDLAGQADFANQLAGGLSVEVADYQELGGSYGSGFRDQGMILLCMVQLGLEERAANLANIIAERLNHAPWLSTQSAGVALVSMAAFATMGEHKLDFEIAFNQGQDLKTQANHVLMKVPIENVGQAQPQIVVRNHGERRLFVQLVRRGIPGTNFVSNAQKDLEQSVTYRDESGNVIDPSQLDQGQDFTVEVMVRNPNRGRRLEELALAHMVPSGWEIYNERLANSQDAFNFDAGEYRDYRDDRVYTFFDLEPQESKTFRIMVNASFQGRFYLPSIRTQAMYDNRIYAQQAGGWVSVSSRP